MFHDRKPVGALALALVALSACGGGEDKPDTGDDAGPPADASIASNKANVKFKGNDRLRADFARTLGLPTGKVCSELGKYSCSHQVHRVQLLGTAAYDLGINEPLEATSLTSPIAVDRMALAACAQRVDRDLAGAETPLIWGGLDIEQGLLTDVEDDSVTAAITVIYQRAIQRSPTPAELEHHRDLYREIERVGSTNTARDWAVLSCFLVMTSVEQLFY